jgi:heme/copper-type cytochrome/quinol oxidase subunit 4
VRLYRYMERIGDKIENMGVWTVTVLVAVIVVVYSLWGASVLKAQKGPAFSVTPILFGTNL